MEAVVRLKTILDAYTLNKSLVLVRDLFSMTYITFRPHIHFAIFRRFKMVSYGAMSPVFFSLRLTIIEIKKNHQTHR